MRKASAEAIEEIRKLYPARAPEGRVTMQRFIDAVEAGGSPDRAVLLELAAMFRDVLANHKTLLNALKLTKKRGGTKKSGTGVKRDRHGAAATKYHLLVMLGVDEDEAHADICREFDWKSGTLKKILKKRKFSAKATAEFMLPTVSRWLDLDE